MLVQDALTGYLHEVPEGQLYEVPEFAEYPEVGEVVYDGLGNPVGGLPFLPALASLIPGIAQAIPQVGRIIGGLLPGGGGAQAAAPAVAQAVGGAVRALAPGFRPPWPAGWIRPQLPYTGLGPNRLYMRCATWPGPRGLVPAFAAQAPAALMPAQAAAGMMRARRFRRRR